MRLIWIAALAGLAGCTDCSLNGGWERAFNPFCVERSHDSASRVDGSGEAIVADQRQPCTPAG